jgi:DNA mismatch repair protein MutL
MRETEQGSESVQGLSQGGDSVSLTDHGSRITDHGSHLTDDVSHLPPPAITAGRIHILEDAVANQIAAGEVIERPASVVKELVENAVDAGGTRVTVELEDGGKRLIRITDNGCGMSMEEAVLALQRHATSKIAAVEDLARVRTLGFRGEALPSIASVARVTLVTRVRGALSGVKLEVEGGEVRELTDVGAPEGTAITVRDLFYNTPARLKFLKSARTELNQSSDTLTRLALSHNEIAVQLTHDGTEVLRSPGSPEALNVIAALFGREVARELLPVSYDRPGLTIRGYVSRPTYHRPTRSGQSFFVNGRFVRNRTLSHALDEAFRATMPGGRHPFAALLLDLDPGVVDVNVHPTKAEVRFLREWELHRAMHEAVKEALGAFAVTAPGPPLAAHATLSQAEWVRGATSAEPGALGVGSGSAPAAAPAAADGEIDPFAELPTDPTSSTQSPTPDSQSSAPTLAVDLASQPLRPIAQLWNSFIAAEGASGLLIIDQHLAHERVLFERLTAEQEGSTVASQRLAMPVTLALTHRQALAIDERLPELATMGFDLEPFGRDAFLIRAVPTFVRQGGEAVVLREIVDTLVAAPEEKLTLRRERVAATAACKSAIKKGERLAFEEMQRLLEDLSRTPHPFTCPHGCPIAVEISFQELLRRFKRA